MELRETVVLKLKNVIYRHTEFPSLEEFLIERYGFKKMEEKEREVSASRDITPIDRKRIVYEEEVQAPIVAEEVEKRHSSLKSLEGSYLDAKIMVHLLGEIISRKDIVEVSEEERYPVYTVEYQMLKLVSESGYALQCLIERLCVDLGLRIGKKEWFFHRI
ncbi:MAG: hypothetical protein QXN86_02060 [Candidatus Methanomethylicaceae archaeon]